MKHLYLLAAASLVLTGCGSDDDDEVVNYAPEVVSDNFTTTVDTPFSDMLTATDENGDTLTFALADAPSNGTVEVASDGSFTFTPASEFTGEDMFTFTVTDGESDPVSGTIGITVEAEQVESAAYIRAAFNQSATDMPLPVNGREFSDDDDPTAYDDLLNDY